MIKIEAAARLKATITPHPWAKEMLDVVKTAVRRSVYNEIAGDTGEGAVVQRSEAEKIMKALKAAGFKGARQVGDVKIIKSNGPKGTGLSFDYSEDIGAEDDECVVLFFNENM